MFLKKVVSYIFLAGSILFFSGCSTPHTIYLQNGNTIDTISEPSFDDDTGFYKFEDLSGREGVIDKRAVLKVQEK